MMLGVAPVHVEVITPSIYARPFNYPGVAGMNARTRACTHTIIMVARWGLDTVHHSNGPGTT